jgi:hypothetical protein
VIRAAVACAAVVLAAGLLGGGVAGSAGAVAVSAAAAAIALLAARLAVPPAPRRPAPPRRAAADPAAAYPAYRRIRSDLMWAATSGRSFDGSVRPLLARLARAALADRQRVDLDADPAAARDLLGPALWPLVDPAARLPDALDRVGVDRRTIARVVDRLEALNLEALNREAP